MTFQLIYWSTYPQIHPKINLPVYPHASPLPKNKDLPVTPTTCVPAYMCTRSWPDLFIFILILYKLDGFPYVLTQDSAGWVRKLADFLEVHVSEELCNDIATAVAFSTQKEQEESISDQYSLTHIYAIYRKGASQL